MSENAAKLVPSALSQRHIGKEKSKMASKMNTCAVVFVALSGIFVGQLVSVVTQTPEPAAVTVDPAFVDETELRWNTWTEWSECTASCAGGQQLRLKVCSEEEDANCTMMLETDDAEKVGYRVQWGDCNTHPCPIHGGWGAFGNWSVCSATCDQGYQSRKRRCDKPEAKYGGDACAGEALEHRFCSMDPCPKEKKGKPMLPQETFTEADKRPSAISIGSLGIGILAGTVSMLICLDFITLGHHCAIARRNLRHIRPKTVAPIEPTVTASNIRLNPAKTY